MEKLEMNLCKQVDNRDSVYDLDLLKRMYKYLNNILEEELLVK